MADVKELINLPDDNIGKFLSEKPIATRPMYAIVQIVPHFN